MSKIKQVIAEITGDGKLFDEGLDEERVRNRGDQAAERQAGESGEAERTADTREGLHAARREKPRKLHQ